MFGGVLVGLKEFIMGKVFLFVCSVGLMLLVFNVWVLLKGMEMLLLCVEK